MIRNPPIINVDIESESILKEGMTTVLQPEMGNLHEFEAIENFCFLDILIPNYDFKSRFCNFYFHTNIEN